MKILTPLSISHKIHNIIRSAPLRFILRCIDFEQHRTYVVMLPRRLALECIRDRGAINGVNCGT
jgi:hypothetical protein